MPVRIMNANRSLAFRVMHWLGQKWDIFRVALVGALLLLVSGWAGDAIKGDDVFLDFFFDGSAKNYHRVKWWVIGILLVGWLVLAVVLRLLLLYAQPVRHLAARNTVRAHRMLVIAVSTSQDWTLEPVQNGFALTLKNLDKEPCLLTGRIDDDLQALKAYSERFNLIMLLRAVEPHLPKLQQLWLMVSKDSRKHVQDLEALLRIYLPDIQEPVRTWPEDLDFEDIHGVYRSIDRLVGKTGERDEEIMIDITGGMKPTSVAMALITLHRNIRCQYVPTNDTGAQPQQYDMAFQPMQH